MECQKTAAKACVLCLYVCIFLLGALPSSACAWELDLAYDYFGDTVADPWEGGCIEIIRENPWDSGQSACFSSLGYELSRQDTCLDADTLREFRGVYNDSLNPFSRTVCPDDTCCDAITYSDLDCSEQCRKIHPEVPAEDVVGSCIEDVDKTCLRVLEGTPHPARCSCVIDEEAKAPPLNPYNPEETIPVSIILELEETHMDIDAAGTSFETEDSSMPHDPADLVLY